MFLFNVKIMLKIPRLLIIAVAIIAVAVFIFIIGLPLLFMLGAFGGSNTSFINMCIPLNGYICNNINQSAGFMTVNIGQTSGINWNNVKIVSEEDNGTSYATPPIQLFNTQRAVYVSGGLQSGQTAIITIPINTSYHGNNIIWAQYTIFNNSTINYVEIAYIPT